MAAHRKSDRTPPHKHPPSTLAVIGLTRTSSAAAPTGANGGGLNHTSEDRQSNTWRSGSGISFWALGLCGWPTVDRKKPAAETYAAQTNSEDGTKTKTRRN